MRLYHYIFSHLLGSGLWSIQFSSVSGKPFFCPLSLFMLFSMPDVSLFPSPALATRPPTTRLRHVSQQAPMKLPMRFHCCMKTDSFTRLFLPLFRERKWGKLVYRHSCIPKEDKDSFNFQEEEKLHILSHSHTIIPTVKLKIFRCCVCSCSGVGQLSQVFCYCCPTSAFKNTVFIKILA